MDISDLPHDLEAKKPAAWKRILGALFVRERSVFVDAAQTWPRRRFVEAHEYGHWLIPWQQASYHLDDERRLSSETKERYEVEANLAAAHLIFQGTEFIKRALDAKVGSQEPDVRPVFHASSVTSPASVEDFVAAWQGRHAVKPTMSLAVSGAQHSVGLPPALTHRVAALPRRTSSGPFIPAVRCRLRLG